MAFQDPLLLRDSPLGMELNSQGGDRVRGVSEEDKALARVPPAISAGNEEKFGTITGSGVDSDPPAWGAGDKRGASPRSPTKFLKRSACRCKSMRSRRETTHVSLHALKPPRRAKEWQGLRVRYSTTCLLEMIMAGPGKRRTSKICVSPAAKARDAIKGARALKYRLKRPAGECGG